MSSFTDLKIVDAEAAETPKERKGQIAKRSLFGDSDDDEEEEDTASRNGNSKTESINSLESTGKHNIRWGSLDFETST